MDKRQPKAAKQTHRGGKTCRLITQVAHQGQVKLITREGKQDEGQEITQHGTKTQTMTLTLFR